jgi:hypothetical protein
LPSWLWLPKINEPYHQHHNEPSIEGSFQIIFCQCIIEEPGKFDFSVKSNFKIPRVFEENLLWRWNLKARVLNIFLVRQICIVYLKMSWFTCYWVSKDRLLNGMKITTPS